MVSQCHKSCHKYYISYYRSILGEYHVQYLLFSGSEAFYDRLLY